MPMDTTFEDESSARFDKPSPPPKKSTASLGLEVHDSDSDSSELCKYTYNCFQKGEKVYPFAGVAKGRVATIQEWDEENEWWNATTELGHCVKCGKSVISADQRAADHCSKCGNRGDGWKEVEIVEFILRTEDIVA